MKKRRGVCLFALMHKRFPYKKTLNVLVGVRNPTLAVLDGTFGFRKTGIKAFLRKYSNLTLIVHLANGSGRRKGRLYEGELWRNQSVSSLNRLLEQENSRVVAPFVKRIRRFLKFWGANAGPKHSLVLSPELETNMSSGAKKTVLKLLEREAKMHETLINPVNTSLTTRKFGAFSYDYAELHSCGPSLPNKYSSWSNDGCDIDFGQQNVLNQNIKYSTMLRWARGLKSDKGNASYWVAETQGLRGGGSTSVPRPRNRSFVIDPRFVQSIRRLEKVSQ